MDTDYTQERVVLWVEGVIFNSHSAKITNGGTEWSKLDLFYLCLGEIDVIKFDLYIYSI